MSERRKQWSSTSRSFSRKGSNLLKKWKNIIQKTSSKCLQMSRRCLMKMMMIMIPRVQFCEEAIWRHFYPSITGTSVCKCQRLTCERQTNFSNSLIMIRKDSSLKTVFFPLFSTWKQSIVTMNSLWSTTSFISNFKTYMTCLGSSLKWEISQIA